MAKKTLLAHFFAAGAALSAGAAVVATRYVIAETDPIALAFYRYVIGVMCFAPVLPFLWPKHRIVFSEYAKIATLGVIFFAFFPWSFNASLEYIPAGRGAIGMSTIPIQTLIVAVLFSREKLTGNKFFGVALAFSGIAIVYGQEAMNPSSSNYLIGDSLMLLGGFCAEVYSVFSRATLNTHGPLFVTALAMVFGAMALLPLSYFGSGLEFIPSFSRNGWIAVIFLGSFASALQFSLFTWALRWLTPTTTALYLTLSPITAMLLGILLIGEPLTLTLLIGLSIVLTGIFVGNGMVGKIGRQRPLIR
jgi:drug/metabolite transporter (DMT)-like permease